MLKGPLVSVIIPVYNREKHLRDTIESVLSQSYRKLEIVIVNDGSTDGSLDIIKEYASVDNRIKLVDKKNEGLPSARKSGLDNSSGEYVIHFDADDVMNSLAVEKFVSRALETSADIVTARFITRYSDRDVAFSGEFFDVMSGKDYLRLMLCGKAFFCVWIRFCRRSLYYENKIDFNGDISFGEDAILMTQLFYYSNIVSFLNYDVVIYNRTDDSMTEVRNISSRRLMELHSFPECIDKFLQSKGVRDEYDLECGYMYVRNMMDLLSFNSYTFVVKDIERCIVILKRYPQIKSILPERYIKLIRYFSVSKILGKLYFRKKYGVFPDN